MRRFSPYTYVFSNPLRFIDPDGRSSIQWGQLWLANQFGDDDELYSDENEENEKTSHFDDLWNNYPSENPKHKDPNTGKDIFNDHCAIKLSEALIKSGMKLDGYSGTTCWGGCSEGSGYHAIRAQELASYLKDIKKMPVKILTGKNYEDYVIGKTGIIFFKDYWQRKGEKGDVRTGDHIDLWNKNKLASIGHFVTFIRRTFPEISENFLDMSDLRKSKQVLFFEIK